MKVLFMGTPDIAATALQTLCESELTVVGAVCQPDRPRGRGMVLTPPPVKQLAEKMGIPVFQPTTLKDGAFLPTLAALAPDVIAVVAYGKILPPDLLSFCQYGCINLHVSLLPKYRGAAPMQRAIMAGECETGVCTMQMDEGLDTGDILLCESFPIAENDNFEAVHDNAARIGAALLLKTLTLLPTGSILPTPQDERLATYAEKITKEDCLLDFNKSAKALHAQIRGLSPIPLSYTTLPNGKLLKVVSARTVSASGKPGEVLSLQKDGVLVACGEGALLLEEVVPEGKGKMKAQDFARGRQIAPGDILGV